MRKTLLFLFCAVLFPCSDLPAAGVEEMEKLAAQGDAKTQYVLGMTYAEGSGVPEEAAKGVEWYGIAAARGLAAAENYFGAMYERGQGVPKDEATAVGWYQKAAGQGFAAAQLNLAMAY